MQYISARQAAEKWSISQRRVLDFCSENRIEGAMMVDSMWIIPVNANKPIDKRTVRAKDTTQAFLKPFVKWAGGKSQLLNEIRKTYPEDLGNIITKYAEPFVGGGAVLFDVISNFEIKEVYISDTNAELINTYRIIRDDVTGLIALLTKLKLEFMQLDSIKQKEYYYNKRDKFNDLKINGDKTVNTLKAALFIFLNKTCFNGLYRVNQKGLFNVPMGAYKNPTICDDTNLKNISKALQKVKIVCGDYRESSYFIDNNTFVYIDPPYRPLTNTSKFTAYTENLFDDDEQIMLAEFVHHMINKGAKIVISNSDPKNSKNEDDFFDKLYSSFNINRVFATRMINCNSDLRGKINELLISTF